MIRKMRRRSLPSVVIVPMLLVQLSASELNVEWERDLTAGRTDASSAVQETADGGFIVSGNKLIRTDSEGRILWERKPSQQLLNFSTARELDDGGFLVGGSTQSNNVVSVYLFRVASDGRILWEKIFEPNSDAYYMIRTESGDVVLTGWSRPGRSVDAFLWRITEDGEIVWRKSLGGDDYDIGYCVRETKDGGFIIAGSTQSFLRDPRDSSDFYLARTDDEGELIWERSFNSGRLDDAWSVEQTCDGGFILTGRTWPEGGGEELYVRRTDPQGNRIWDRTFPGAERARGHAVLELDDGGFLVSGRTQFPAAGPSYSYLLRTDSRGTLAWDKILGPTIVSEGASIFPTSDRGFVLAATATSRRIFLIKLSAEVSSGFRRSDSNADGTVDLADVVDNLTYQFLGTFRPPCLDACDFDDSGEIDVTDPIASLAHQFLGSAPPAPPGGESCGPDPTPDLGCESYAACDGNGP